MPSLTRGKQDGAGTRGQGGRRVAPSGRRPRRLCPGAGGLRRADVGLSLKKKNQIFIGPNSYQMAPCGNRVLKPRFLLKRRNNRVSMVKDEPHGLGPRYRG